jgi:flagellar assembly protein FliH
MSSSSQYSSSVTILQYRDMTGASVGNAEPSLPGGELEAGPAMRRKDVQLSQAELAGRIAREREIAASETEQKLRAEYEQKLRAARATIADAVTKFENERDNYYAKVEAEIVQLALSIAAKILHRESQVDPMLVAALVRLAMDKMREDSSVTIRVGAGKGESWKQYFAETTRVSHVEVVEDPKLHDQDCQVETELGTADFSLEKQLKEVEQGFFDLLGLRPAAR